MIGQTRPDKRKYVSVEDGGLSYQEAAAELGRILKINIDPKIFERLEGRFATNISPEPLIPGENRLRGFSHAFDDAIHDVTLFLDIPVTVNVKNYFFSFGSPTKDMEGYEAQFVVSKLAYQGKNPPSSRAIVQRNLLGLVDLVKDPNKYPIVFERVYFGISD